MAGKYAVNWRDNAYPEIVIANEYGLPGQPFIACKQEIVDHFQALVVHSREQIANVRKLRTTDIN